VVVLALLFVSFGAQAQTQHPIIGSVRVRNGDSFSVVRFGNVVTPTEYVLLANPEVPFSSLKRLQQEGSGNGTGGWTATRLDGTLVHGTGLARHEFGAGGRVSVPLKVTRDLGEASPAFSFVCETSASNGLLPRILGTSEVVEITLEPSVKPLAGAISLKLDLLSGLRGYSAWMSGEAIKLRKMVETSAAAAGSSVTTAPLIQTDLARYALLMDLLVNYHCATKDEVLNGAMDSQDYMDCEERKHEDSLWRQPGQLLTDADLPLIATRYYGIQLFNLAQKRGDRIVLPAEGGEHAATPLAKDEEKPNSDQSLAKSLKVVAADHFFSTESVQQILARKLRPDTLKLLTDGPYALWYLTQHGTLRVGNDYCWAIVGLTESPAKGRAARIPDAWATTMRQVKRRNADAFLSDEEISDCRSMALKGSIDLFAGWDVAKQLERVERTRGKGSVASPPPGPAKGTTYTSHVGVSDNAQQRVADTVPNDFSEAFDYRKVGWFLLADSFHFDDQVACFGIVSIGGHPLKDRNARFPQHYYWDVRELSANESRPQGAESSCKDNAVVSALESALEDPWDQKNLFADYATTREDGVPLITAFRKKAGARAAAHSTPTPGNRGLADALRAPGQCQPPRGSTLRYRDQCSNGDCIRTFEGGCSVRFQAPYCYDALSSQWQWKPDGC
jgi:hypothetical protein